MTELSTIQWDQTFLALNFLFVGRKGYPINATNRIEIFSTSLYYLARDILKQSQNYIQES